MYIEALGYGILRRPVTGRTTIDVGTDGVAIINPLHPFTSSPNSKRRYSRSFVTLLLLPSLRGYNMRNDVNGVADDHHLQSSFNQKSTKSADQNLHLMVQKISPPQSNGQLYCINGNGVSKVNINSSNNLSHKKMNGKDFGTEVFKREMRDLEKMLSKLNPVAQEFVSLSPRAGYHRLVVPLPQAAWHYGLRASIETDQYL